MDQGGLGREGAHSCSPPAPCEQGEGRYLGLTGTTVSHPLGPKEVAESANLSVSKEDDVRQYVVRKTPKTVRNL